MARATLGELCKQLDVRPLSSGLPVSAEQLARPVGDPQPLDTAAEGALTWLSPRHFAKRPTWTAGEDCVVIAPVGAAARYASSRAVFLEVEAPKLAFIRAVEACFSDVSGVDFSTERIDPSARVAASARIAIGAVIGPRVTLGERVVVGPNTVLANCRVGDDSRVGANCTIGLPGFGYEKDDAGRYHRFPHLGDVVIGRDVDIGSNTCIDRGSLGSTVIGDGCKIDNLVHVAHNVVLGTNAVVIANSMLGGSVKVGDNAWIAPSVSIMNQATIGAAAVAGLGAVVLRDVEPGAVVVGNPARPLQKKGTS